jgi:hypothetical protein
MEHVTNQVQRFNNMFRHTISQILDTGGRAMGQAVSRRLLTAYVRVRAQDGSCGIFG